MSDAVKHISFRAPHIPVAADVFRGYVVENMENNIHAPIQGYRHPGSVEFQQAEKMCRSLSAPWLREPVGLSLSVNGDIDDDIETLHPLLPWVPMAGSDHHDRARGWWHIIRSPIEERGTGLSMFMTTSEGFDPRDLQDWTVVQVVGRLSPVDSESYRDGLVELCGLASSVFGMQPTRLFLHGLYVRESRVEQWVFDRSGVFCWDTFVVCSPDTLNRFLGLLLGYRLMADDQLGRSGLIKRDEHGYFVLMDGSTSSEPQKKLYIRRDPIACRKAMVGPATTAYLARDPLSGGWGRIVKFKWRHPNDRLEERMFKIAREKHVEGVVSLEHFKVYPDFSISASRQHLSCGPYRKLLVESPSASHDEPGIEQWTEPLDRKLDDQVPAMFVTTPAGRALNTFKTRLELLLALRDAINAHRSLYQRARIVHQDVSDSNVIIVDPEKEGDPPVGWLIDLDVALDLNQGPGRPGHIIGKRVFIAIGKFQHQPRTYRHDLEGFLYVLLWVLMMDERDDDDDRPDVLKAWEQDSRDDCMEAKIHQMTKEEFPNLLSELPQRFRSLGQLAEDLRDVLFPVLPDGTVFYGTKDSSDELYDDIVGAFEQAIAREMREPQNAWYDALTCKRSPTLLTVFRIRRARTEEPDEITAW
ncbi:hypothetical protein ANO11243_027200 [Dothideomycetidae sp. 11243]|nr:hypothetical protein ANO11243_027200 [fungal sp. No.11243]